MDIPAETQTDEAQLDSNYQSKSETSQPSPGSYLAKGWNFTNTKLGDGGFSRVHLAKNSLIGTQVAAKVVYSTERRAIENEVKSLMALRGHPHIISLLDVVIWWGQIVIIQEYCQKGVFETLDRLGYFSEQTSRKLFLQLMSAVNYMHENGIVHRDLKLQNLMLTESGDLKVIDLGLSSRFNLVTKLDSPCGSYNYAAPEILAGKSYWGPEVDIWSCGVLLFNFLTGKAPFDDARTAIKLREKYVYPPQITKDSKSLILKMLRINAKKRATMKQVLEHRWSIQSHQEPLRTASPLPRFCSPLKLHVSPTFNRILGRSHKCQCVSCGHQDKSSQADRDDLDLMEIVEKMEGFGFDQAKMLQELTMDHVAPSFLTATFLLMWMEKKRALGDELKDDKL